MPGGCEYVLEHNLVCVRVCVAARVHPSLIENKRPHSVRDNDIYTRLMYTEHIHAVDIDNGKTMHTSIR